MRKDSSYTLRCFVIAILALFPFNGLAQIPEFLNANKTPELKPYDYSAEYDGLKDSVKEINTFFGYIKSVFGNKTLEKGGLISTVKYLPDGLRMEAHIGAPHSSLYDGVKYIFKNERLDTLLIYKYFDNIQGYSERPTEMITYDYLTQDSIIEKYYEFKEVRYGIEDWEQTKQLNTKIQPEGFQSIYFPSIGDEGKIILYTSQGLKFKFKDERSNFFDWPTLFKNNIFRIDRLCLIERAMRYIGRVEGDMRTGDLKTDDLGRIIRIRPSQKKLNQLLADGNNSYKATHLEYDENGNISKIVYSKYLTNGTRQNRNWRHSEDDVIKVDYTYDSYGNWTMAKITTYHQSWEKYLSSYGKETGKEESYYIREISYYSDNDTTPPASLFLKEEEKIDDGIGQPIYDNVEETPTYSGGKYRLTKDIVVGLPDKYKSEREGKYPAQIIVKFAVYKSGKIDNLEIIKGGENLSEDESNEIMAAFKQLDSFTPGKNNGQPVNSWLTFPVQLYLSFSQLNEDAQREVEIKRERDAQEEAKRICTFAYHAIEQCSLRKEYNNMSRFFNGSDAVADIPDLGTYKNSDYTVPENIDIEKLKSYEVNGGAYTFIKKDKTVVPDVHYNRMVRDLDYSYHDFGFLSDDKRFALITLHNNLTKDFIYLVEFEDNRVKSINCLPYKKSKDFVMPQLEK